MKRGGINSMRSVCFFQINRERAKDQNSDVRGLGVHGVHSFAVVWGLRLSLTDESIMHQKS